MITPKSNIFGSAIKKDKNKEKRKYMNIIIDTKTVHDTKSAMDGNISCLEPFSGGYSENQKTTQLKI